MHFTKHLISRVTDICPLRLTGSGVTAGHPARRGAAADEAGRPRLVRSGQRDQSAPTDRTLKTHLHALLIKTLLGPATKSHPRGKTPASNVTNYTQYVNKSLHV